MPISDERRAATDRLLRANSAALAAIPVREAIDPSRTPVFQPDREGKLRPIEGWTTTGPFDFGRWAHNIDWLGIGRDLGGIAAGAVGGGGAPGLISRRAVTGVVGDGLTAMDKATLGAGVYGAGDRTLQAVEPKRRPKHW